MKHYFSRNSISEFPEKPNAKLEIARGVENTPNTQFIIATIKRRNKCTTIALREPDVEYRIQVLRHIDQTIDSVINGTHKIVFRNTKLNINETENRLAIELINKRNLTIKQNLERQIRYFIRSSKPLQIEFASEVDYTNKYQLNEQDVSDYI